MVYVGTKVTFHMFEVKLCRSLVLGTHELMMTGTHKICITVGSFFSFKPMSPAKAGEVFAQIWLSDGSGR